MNNVLLTNEQVGKNPAVYHINLVKKGAHFDFTLLDGFKPSDYLFFLDRCVFLFFQITD